MFIRYSFLFVAGNYNSFDKYFIHVVSICILLSQLLHLISLEQVILDLGGLTVLICKVQITVPTAQGWHEN